MEEDVLSDVVPSNIVSRQVKLGFVDYSQAQYLSSASQESEGGESEYDDEAADEMEVDELQSDGEKVSIACIPWFIAVLPPLHPCCVAFARPSMRFQSECARIYACTGPRTGGWHHSRPRSLTTCGSD